jgi:hypothetical protein
MEQELARAETPGLMGGDSQNRPHRARGAKSEASGKTTYYLMLVGWWSVEFVVDTEFHGLHIAFEVEGARTRLIRKREKVILEFRGPIGRESIF